MNLFIEIAEKSFGFVLLVSVVVWMARGQSAALRHRLWALGFVCLAVLPMLAIRVPAIRIERPAAVQSIRSSQSIPVKAAPLQLASATLAAPASAHDASDESTSDLPFLAFIAWALGAFIFLGRLGIEITVASRLARGGIDRRALLPPGCPANTRIVSTTSVDVPVTMGYLHPIVLLPSSCEDWSDAKSNAILLHECAHVRRGDWAWMIFARVISALYWPNLLVHWAASRLRIESEHAADDAVLNEGLDAPGYAATLVDVAEGLRARRMAVAIEFVEPGTLKWRVAQILSRKGRREPLRRRTSAVTFLFSALVIVPFAATRLVAGPAVSTDGVADLGHGQRTEIVAITEMQGEHAVSWDMKGALLSRPLGLSDRDIQSFGSARDATSKAIVRYVIFRTDNDDIEFPWPMVSSGQEQASLPYYGSDTVFGFQDALGGSYHVMQLVAAPGSRTAEVSFRVPSGDWKVFASRSFKNGVSTAEVNPSVKLRLASASEQNTRSKISFVLPKSQAECESMVRLLPGNVEGVRFECMTGLQTAPSATTVSSIAKVELLSRPMRKVTMRDIPLAPNPKAVYVPRHFLPDTLITADHGLAKLPDGTSMRIWSISNENGVPGKGWDWEGHKVEHKPISNELPNIMQEDLGPKLPGPARKPIHLWMLRQPVGAPDPQFLYDGEGWPVAQALLGVALPEGMYRCFNLTLDHNIRHADLVARVGVGTYATIARLTPGKEPTASWRFSPKQGWTGSLRVEYSDKIAKRVAWQENDYRPLDANGQVVTRPDGAMAISEGQGWVEFDLPKASADRVKTVEVRVRQFVWVKYPNVPLTPK
ncbi:MAG: M56 family metallopeptidase [Fimbriimonas sp.]|nr:M56 family metallopeptidase [Fimbriimonas sp.]